MTLQLFEECVVGALYKCTENIFFYGVITSPYDYEIPRFIVKANHGVYSLIACSH